MIKRNRERSNVEMSVVFETLIAVVAELCMIREAGRPMVVPR